VSLTFGSLFAGIGGFDLGFERAGMQCKWQVEIDPYCQRVLSQHWPNVRRWDDVRTFPPGPNDEWRVDVICGGFPCQDISNAGLRAGIDGERSGLWRDYMRIVRMVRPRYVVVENVAALLERGIGRVLGDLAAGGYDAEWSILPACALGASHTRARLFIVAYANSNRLEGWKRKRLKSESQPLQIPALCDSSTRRKWEQLPTPVFCRSVDGISKRVDRTKGLGNAVVPQVAQWIGERIIEASK
jgi:DNA (cytosine-5)-methyltransferase 1